MLGGSLCALFLSRFKAKGRGGLERVARSLRAEWLSFAYKVQSNSLLCSMVMARLQSAWIMAGCSVALNVVFRKVLW